MQRGPIVSRPGILLVALVLVTCAPLVIAAPKSVWSGVYTPQQAAAGEKIYFDRCASCHGDDLAGVERAPAVAGTAFLDSWHGKTLRKLFEVIESMPPDEPAVVSAAEAADVLAFILYSSEFPSGSTPLPADRAQLAGITFERTKP
jgi:mono/diheme cytochrome c family protein